MDLIERKKAIDICQKRLWETALNNVDISSIYVDIADNRVANWLMELPSAQPEYTEQDVREAFNSGYSCGMEAAASAEPSTGTWEEKQVMSADDSKSIEQWQSARCSVCGHYHTIPYLYSFHESNFCPHCGARNGGN